MWIEISNGDYIRNINLKDCWTTEFLYDEDSEEWLINIFLTDSRKCPFYFDDVNKASDVMKKIKGILCIK